MGSLGVVNGNRKSSVRKSVTPRLPNLYAGEPRDVWQRFFVEQKPKPAEVAEIVRRLHQSRQHEHVIACIETALIQSEPQPWMYEVLGLSMEFAKRPKEDVERAMLSRVDFTAAKFPDILESAAYLKSLGCDHQALVLYRQAARLAPARPEAYILGLRVARDLKDVPAVEWGAAGVLTNVWQTGYETHHREAENIAAVVEESLSKSGRVAESDTLKASVAAAHQRDLILRLTWAGNADLDLSVEEPNGGVCSFESRFTQGGGAYTHDGYGPKIANCFEEYICASGLPGDYVVRVSVLSGDVVGRRAELVIRRYVGTADESEKTMPIPIDGRDKVVRLTLHEGRRQSLVERSAADLPIHGDFASSVAGGARQAIGQVVPASSLGGGAIGFQPVIGTIPEGLSLSAMAIVTGDRRYVRLSLAPFLSGLREINTFSIPSGR